MRLRTGSIVVSVIVSTDCLFYEYQYDVAWKWSFADGGGRAESEVSGIYILYSDWSFFNPSFSDWVIDDLTEYNYKFVDNWNKHREVDRNNEGYLHYADFDIITRTESALTNSIVSEINERYSKLSLKKLFFIFQTHVQCNYALKLLLLMNIFVNFNQKILNISIWCFNFTKMWIIVQRCKKIKNYSYITITMFF